MSHNRKQSIDKIIAQKENEIKTMDDDFYGDVIGVAQALGQLRKALDQVDQCLDNREFEKASSLGYSEISSAFIFLQRCLGGLNGTANQKEKMIQDICIELCGQLENISYEEVAPSVEQELESLKPIKNPLKIEIILGEKTVEKLQVLQNIRQTPIEHLVEAMVASAIQKDGAYWQSLEENKPAIANIKQEKKEFYTSDEVSSHMEALDEQQQERVKNLY